MKNMSITIIATLGTFIILLLSACSSTASLVGTTSGESSVSAETTDRPEGWTEASHGSEADPNYEVVFPEDEVNTITITIDPEDWEAMQANMTNLFGEQGTGDFGRSFPGGGGFTEGGQPPEGFQPGERPQPPQGEMPQEMPEGANPGQPDQFRGGPGGGDMTPENPMWVESTIEFEGQTWTNVGVRYKGNSSLTSGWRIGTLKIPLKLDFDEFEDKYPEIEDQRFYGFKQLSLANGFSDASFLRDAATSQILQEGGLPAAETAFYQVILDYGEGPVTLGLYTMIEVVDDTLVSTYFGSDDGNIYDADGSAASFAASTQNQIEDSFQKENNEDVADWSDIEKLFEVLHSDLRTSDPAAWRAELESIFNVNAFLDWLAISAVIQHWDAYGAMTHNYYLYNDPDTGQLTWISWDHNMAMSNGMGGGGDRGFGGPGGRSVSLDKADIGENWPLIRFLLDDPVYYQQYLTYLEETIAGPFNPDQIVETYQSMAELIAPYASADVGEEAFETAVQQLIDHAIQRSDAVEAFLKSEEE